MGERKTPVRFLIYSLGRSGSTAIADELSATNSTVCYQEPIVSLDKFSQDRKDRLIAAYKKDGIAYYNQQQGTQIHRYGTLREIAPSITATEYLDMLENYEGHRGKLAVGVKQVQGQLESFPEFWREFKKRGYIVFCLIRKNITKASLSAAVAAQRGLYNTTKQDHQSESCVVPLDKLEHYLELFGGARERLSKNVRKVGLEPHEIFYEDFMANRHQFHEYIFETLGIPFELPRKSEFKKLVPQDLRGFVENYSDVESFLRRRGLGDQLDAL